MLQLHLHTEVKYITSSGEAKSQTLLDISHVCAGMYMEKSYGNNKSDNDAKMYHFYNGRPRRSPISSQAHSSQGV